tara:strand:+ start:591 stop:1109 length:519 start_codon:yes stop_codon:yes gene_type:complete
MCAGPIKNLYEDATGITAQKDEAQAQFKAQQAAAQAAAEAEDLRVKNLEKAKQQAILDASTTQADISATAGAELAEINQTNTDLMINMQAAAAGGGGGGPKGPSADELAARGAAQTSLNVLKKEKKKKKGALNIPYSASKRKDGQRGPKSTKADLQIEGQTQSTGTGTNLAI